MWNLQDNKYPILGKMGIPTLPPSQHMMMIKNDDTSSTKFNSDILWDSEQLADNYEHQSKLLRNLEKDQVVNNLKRVLKALETRDNTRYCFSLAGDILLTSNGFRVRTEDKDGLQRWAYRASRSSDRKEIALTILQDINSIVSQDPDKVKKRLGANIYLRDYVDQEWICCAPSRDPDCPPTACPCFWPFCLPATILASFLDCCYGNQFGDPRTF